MERLDAIVAGIGVLVVAVALGGVVTAPPAPEAASFAIGFVADRATLPAATANLNGDGTSGIPVSVPARNVSRVEFAVTVQLTGAPPTTTVNVVVTGPNGQRATGAGQGGAPGVQSQQTATIAVEVAPLPTAVTVQAADGAAALGSVNRTSANGTGTWNVEVTVQSGLPASPAQAAITVATTVVSWHAVVQPEVTNPR